MHRHRRTVRLSISLIVCMLIGVAWVGLVRAQSLTLQPADLQGSPEARVEVPIQLSGPARGLGPVQLELVYDPDVLQAVEAGPGDLLSGAMVEHSIPFPGRLRIAMVTDGAIDGEGALFSVQFDVVGNRGDTSTLQIENARAYDREQLTELQVDTIDGSFTVGGLPPWLLYAMAGLLVLLLLLLWLRRRQQRRAVDSPVE